MLEMPYTLSTKEVRFLQKIRWQVWARITQATRVYDALLRKISKISKYQHTNTQIRKFKWKVLWDLRYYAESWKVTKQDKYQEKYECLGLIRDTLWISMEYSRGNSYTVINSHLTWMLSILVLKNKKNFEQNV